MRHHNNYSLWNYLGFQQTWLQDPDCQLTICDIWNGAGKSFLSS